VTDSSSRVNMVEWSVASSTLWLAQCDAALLVLH